MNRTINGGIELGLLQAAQKTGEALSEADLKRIEYLDSLPKNTWVAIDENGKAISDCSAVALLTKRLDSATIGGAE